MSEPIWQLFKDGTDAPVQWSERAVNRRFAVYSPAGPSDPTQDVVWDKETNLVWARNANLPGAALNWLDANAAVRALKLAGRLGWRLPTVEELSSLIDPRKSNPALPDGQPFVAVRAGEGEAAYWTCTGHEESANSVWCLNLGKGVVVPGGKGGAGLTLGYVWAVRGGAGG